jgi:hypothetical protein
MQYLILHITYSLSGLRMCGFLSPCSPYNLTLFLLNIAVEWEALLLHIQEVLGPNLSWRLAILIEVFVVFLSPSRQMLELYLKLGHDHFHSLSSSLNIL